MIGPFRAANDGSLIYLGNKKFDSGINVDNLLNLDSINKHTENLFKDEFWFQITKINDRVVKSAYDFFNQRETIFINLPLTTRMISSPGAVYGKEKIDYTTDTCPITLKWFDLPELVFLSESSQIYLELALAQRDIREVFSIYNSFRKEEADFCHLSEFHHIEFEAKLIQDDNIDIIKSFIVHLTDELLKHCLSELKYFIDKSNLEFIENLGKGIGFVDISYKEALDILYKDTQNKKYKNFTLSNFGSWEEIKLTNMLNSIVIIHEYPLLEVPFYHSKLPDSIPEKANNADFIWPGYREFIGSGQRIGNTEELTQKSKIFNLPQKDYQPYIESRRSPYFKTSSGFGMGIERFIQGLLCLPSIHLATIFPRTHLAMRP